MNVEQYPARWWQTLPDGRLHCFLCPRHCHLSEGQHGYCFVRQNVDGRLWQLAYAHPAAVAIDPIEKKPLFHFYPGTSILSLGTAGCNLGCQFCQNSELSRAHELLSEVRLEPSQVIELARQHRTPAIAFTYNEPTVWAEYVVDIARLAQQAGLKTVMVSNGYITAEARGEVYQYIDAANIDLKSFCEDFYARFTLSHLAPVLDTLRWLRRETSVWLEVTNLIIPGGNDALDETRQLAAWIRDELGADVPLHLSAFHPSYRMLDRPPTQPETLLRARDAALHVGLHYVYIGNVATQEGENTVCPSCQRRLICRNRYRVEQVELRDGHCRACGAAIAGRFG